MKGRENLRLTPGEEVAMKGRGWLAVKVNGSPCSSLINRGALRQALIDSLPSIDDTDSTNERGNSYELQYVKHFEQYEETDDVVTVYFTDGTSMK
jgi:hypothetical protein